MTPTGYSRTQIALHWGVAILIVAQFVLHDPIVAAWEAIEKGEVPDISTLVMFHVIGGSLILALAVWRLVLRFKRGAPALPEKEAPILKFFAHLTHWSLYALMIVVGTKVMASRPKHEWKTALACWNLLLSIFSFCGMLRTVPHLLHNVATLPFKVCNSLLPSLPPSLPP